MPRPAKLSLAHLPTPLWRSDALDRLVGLELWVKRDDMTGGAEAGNKVRKLEYLLAAANAEDATHVVTCGGEQSNHARATALMAARLGLACTVLLRVDDPGRKPEDRANLLLCRLAGAEVVFISPAQWQDRAALLALHAERVRAAGGRPYVIPEGGSNGLGSLGYVDAMQEVREQLDLGLAHSREPFDAVVVACGSGGTAAGIALGADEYRVTSTVIAVAVCNDTAYFERAIGSIALAASALRPELEGCANVVVLDAYKGPGYAVASAQQRAYIKQVAAQTGLVLDPVYTGKALFGLASLETKPKRALFVHTGGLPGLLAQPETFSSH